MDFDNFLLTYLHVQHSYPGTWVPSGSYFQVIHSFALPTWLFSNAHIVRL